MKAGLLVMAAMLGLSGCGGEDRLEILTGEAMGTTYRIKTVRKTDLTKPAIENMLAKLDRDLSTWRKDSWVAEFNRAPSGAVMEMPESVAVLVDLSMKYHAQTDGRFDPTIGALIRIWGFGAWRSEWRGQPTDEDLAAARANCGFQHIKIEGRHITKLNGGLMLDFSGIAKGYAVDRMGDLLRDAGCVDFIIEFGGEILASGNHPGRHGWIVGGPTFTQPITLMNEAVAGSGSEHQFRDGLSHIIDPARGHPVPVGPPVSATATTCAEADALATAAFIQLKTEHDID